MLGLAAIAAVLLIVTVFIPQAAFDVPQLTVPAGRTVEGKVGRVTDLGREVSPRGEVNRQRIDVLVDGEAVVVERAFLPLESNIPAVRPGDDVILNASQGPDGREVYFISDFVRRGQLWLLAGAFAVIVILVARGHGAWSLLGLVTSFLVIVRFIVPGILAGYSPSLISFVGATVILGTTLYLSHGVTQRTTVALAGTALSLALTIVLADLSIPFARLSGLVTEEASTLNLLSQGGIDPRGLLLGGIIIGALGVLDDVTVAQTAAVYELRSANPRLDPQELFRRGMNVGRDHIASTVNTLFLAYAGAALPLLIILATQAEPVSRVANQEIVATEIVRTLVGGIGIAAAVPVTTLLAAFVASKQRHIGHEA